MRGFILALRQNWRFRADLALLMSLSFLQFWLLIWVWLWMRWSWLVELVFFLRLLILWLLSFLLGWFVDFSNDNLTRLKGVRMLKTITRTKGCWQQWYTRIKEIRLRWSKTCLSPLGRMNKRIRVDAMKKWLRLICMTIWWSLLTSRWRRSLWWWPWRSRWFGYVRGFGDIRNRGDFFWRQWAVCRFQVERGLFDVIKLYATAILIIRNLLSFDGITWRPSVRRFEVVRFHESGR